MLLPCERQLLNSIGIIDKSQAKATNETVALKEMPLFKR